MAVWLHWQLHIHQIHCAGVWESKVSRHTSLSLSNSYIIHFYGKFTLLTKQNNALHFSLYYNKLYHAIFIPTNIKAHKFVTRTRWSMTSYVICTYLIGHILVEIYYCGGHHNAIQRLHRSKAIFWRLQILGCEKWLLIWLLGGRSNPAVAVMNTEWSDNSDYGYNIHTNPAGDNTTSSVMHKMKCLEIDSVQF